MSKKTILAAITIAGLLLSLVGMQLVEVAKANPFGYSYPHDPHTTVSLGNFTRISRTVYLVFNLNMFQWYPSYLYLGYGNPNYSSAVSSIKCYLDGAYMGNLQPPSTKTFYFLASTSFDNLANGVHNVRLNITTSGTYFHQTEIYAGFPVWDTADTQLDFYSMNFTIAVFPKISEISLGNLSSATHSLPLNFCVDSTPSWIGYSVDGQTNVTISGNTTLRDLPNGNHTLVIFAKDSFGGIGKSDTTYFSIELPTPTPSPSPTQQPTQEPSPTPRSNYYSDWIPYVIIALVIVGIGASAVYLKKRKRNYE